MKNFRTSSVASQKNIDLMRPLCLKQSLANFLVLEYLYVKIIEALKQVFFMWAIGIKIYLIRN